MTEKIGPGTRLLVAIASYGTAGDAYLAKSIEQYKSMPFDVHVVVTANIEKELPPGVELKVGLPTSDPWSLPFAHKKVLAERVNDYDLFIYCEDDSPITEKNIEAFLRVSDVLPETEIPGFLRYEDSPSGARNYINMHGHYHWDPASVCRRGPYTFASLTSEHSACYLLTRKQLQRAIDSGRYLVPPYHGKYDLACTASTDPYTVCGFRKLICISSLEDFLVHHLPDKYTGPGYRESDQCFDKQLRALSAIGNDGTKAVSLLETETKLPAARYSKDFNEPVRQQVVNAIPATVHTLLSVGSGVGKLERLLEEKGLEVTALPLDSVVGACLEGSDIEVVYGSLCDARATLEGRKFDCLLFSNILHLVKSPEKVLLDYVQLLKPDGYVLLRTPNVASSKNKAYATLAKPGYRDLRDYAKSGVQFVSLRNVKEWLAAAGLVVESITWTATPRFEKIVRSFPGLFGSRLGAEIIALGKKSA